MAKRFAITFFVVLGTCIFLIASFTLVLILAPGLSLFGLKYIAKGTHIHDVKTTIVKQVGSFNSSVIVETNEIPVYVVFTEGLEYEVEYYDDYNGFTISNFDDPEISITKDSLGNAIVKVKEFQKFLYESSSSRRYLKIKIPLAGVSGVTDAYRTNVTIRGNNSNVTFEKPQEDSRIPAFNNVIVETMGKLEVKTHVKATTFTYKTGNTIFVAEDRSNTVDAINYVLQSYNGKITIETPVDGDIEATTTNTNIKLISCENLVAKTGFGTVCSAKDGQDVNVAGLVNIETKSGSVLLGTIGAVSGENKIITSSGNVFVKKMGDGTITTSRGSVDVKSLGNVKISTNMGKVYVEEALEAVDISTKRGNVYLGGVGMPVNNPKVFSRLGKVYVYSAMGAVDIETVSSDVEFTNTLSENIAIKCGGKLKAKDLTGRVTISAEKNSNLEFKDVNAETRITFGNNVKNAEIKMLNNSAEDMRYLISGKKVVRYEDNGTGTFSKIEETSSLANNISSGPLFRVDSKEANISVYFKASI